MSKKSSAGRKLDPIRVEMAKKVERARHELAMQMVAERVKIDAEFAADVLKVGGENLREDIKKDARETIARSIEEKNARTQGVVLSDSQQALVDKWDKTGLLDGVKDDLSHCDPAVLIESQQHQPIVPEECCGGEGCLCQSENKDIPLDHPPVWERD